jgi:hypothetical protein
MNVNEKFEIRAHVFNRMTGMLAPGKEVTKGYDFYYFGVNTKTFKEANNIWRVS